ncbi:MAG: hypothetical protein U0414_26935 [Polyangiaceae bacterium]
MRRASYLLLGLTSLLGTAATATVIGCGGSGTTGTGGTSTGSQSTGSQSTGSKSTGSQSTGSQSTGSQSTGNSMSTGTGVPSPGGLFTAPEPWTKDVSGLSPSDRSDAIIGALDSMGGWGLGVFQTDFSIPVFYADGSTPRVTIQGLSPEYCYGGPDCDDVPLQMPIPNGSNIEGSADLNCDIADNDCHILVAEVAEKKLYELYNAYQQGSEIIARGAFTWDLTKAYPDNLRGDQCTSADAAGLPIAGLLPTADEVKAGDVHHALRFILPNEEMKAGVYVHPATHAGGPSSSDANAPPYGVRFRLKSTFDESPYNAGEKVILKALKTFGMVLSDGGHVALTFADDRTTAAKWAEVGITAQSFNDIQVTDFEVVDLGPEIDLTNDCVRNP